MGLRDFGEELLSFGVDVAKETAKSYAKQKGSRSYRERSYKHFG